MNLSMEFCILPTLLLCYFMLEAQAQLPVRFKQRATAFGYPVEEHEVTTSDGYVLTMHRITGPRFSQIDEEPVENKPVVFLMHGFISSSDCWILAEEPALAYMLADAGFDVWLGNCRGNTYSLKHISISPLLPSFWRFSFNDIGKYDLPAMIDYTLTVTGQTRLHYVGHSQGTTVYLIMISFHPQYNSKVRSTHFLAPVAFMGHLKSPPLRAIIPLLSTPNALSALIGSAELIPGNTFFSMAGREICESSTGATDMCANLLFLFSGWDSQHLNKSLIPAFMETHPADTSVLQLKHNAQLVQTNQFKQYDHGALMNYFEYGSSSPPDYNLNNLNPTSPIEVYYSGNDWMVNATDVLNLKSHLGPKANLHYIDYPTWGHFDFVAANSYELKEEINDKVIKSIFDYEGSP